LRTAASIPLAPVNPSTTTLCGGSFRLWLAGKNLSAVVPDEQQLDITNGLFQESPLALRKIEVPHTPKAFVETCRAYFVEVFVRPVVVLWRGIGVALDHALACLFHGLCQIMGFPVGQGMDNLALSV
jgi:hypothetical protein